MRIVIFFLCFAIHLTSCQNQNVKKIEITSAPLATTTIVRVTCQEFERVFFEIQSKKILSQSQHEEFLKLLEEGKNSSDICKWENERILF